jgi:hypothetical protein
MGIVIVPPAAEAVFDGAGESLLELPHPLTVAAIARPATVRQVILIGTLTLSSLMHHSAIYAHHME